MKRLLCILFAFGILLFSCGCGAPNDEPDSPEWEPQAPELLKLTDYLTAADVLDATGIRVNEGVLEENDTVLLFATNDYATQVSFLMEEPEVAPADYLAALSAQYEQGTLTEVKNLGEKAFWCAQTGELLVGGNGHIIAINLASNVLNSEACLLAARKMATRVLNKLA